MVLSFMSQLSAQRRGQSGESSGSGSENPEIKMTTNPGIRLRLVDRRKENVEGFAFTQLVDDVRVHWHGLVFRRWRLFTTREGAEWEAWGLLVCNSCMYACIFDFSLNGIQAQLFKVLDVVHEATLSGIPVTKRYVMNPKCLVTIWPFIRDIYYKDIPLFKSQKIVDTVKTLIVFCHSPFLLFRWQLVDDIAATFELDRSDLNIVSPFTLPPDNPYVQLQRSSSKGLICGSGISINLVSGDVIKCNDTEVHLVYHFVGQE